MVQGVQVVVTNGVHGKGTMSLRDLTEEQLWELEATLSHGPELQLIQRLLRNLRWPYLKRQQRRTMTDRLSSKRLEEIRCLFVNNAIPPEKFGFWLRMVWDLLTEFDALRAERDDLAIRLKNRRRE